MTASCKLATVAVMECFACGRPHALASGERVGFRDSCSHCAADLHVCRNCRHHDPSRAHACRETQAERVGDTERANRCEWFAAGRDADEPGGGAGRARARAALDALFRKD